jgi:phosphoglycerate dehydrogenase-like enzyme
MARVLFACPMDAERRAVLAERNRGAFEAVILDDVSEGARSEAWPGADVLVTTGFGREIPADLATRAPRLRMIQTLVAGVDHLPYRVLPKTALVCGNAGAYNTSVGEHTMALLLAAAKDAPQRTREIVSGVFDQNAPSKALAGTTALILGMGGIGATVAGLCKAFRMHVIGVGRSGKLVPPADEAGVLADVPRLLPRADYVVVALPLTARTNGLVDRAFLAAMKEDAVLVNVARGKIVVEDDLFEHLRAHPTFRAALDVWWVYPSGKEGRPFHRPFHELPNVVMTPHNANAIPGQRRWAMEAALDNVLRFLRGETPRNLVNVTEYDTVGEPR